MKHAPLFKLLAGSVLAFVLVGHPLTVRASQDNNPKQDASTKKAAQYPNATRKAPKLDLTSQKEQDALNKGLDAVNAGDAAGATAILQPIVDSSKSQYAKALALQGLASIKYNAGDAKSAITLLSQALKDGVLPNDTYFQLEYELAQFQLADKQYQASLDTVAKWRAEGKKETADSYALEGNSYYRLEKYPQAIAAIKKAQSLTDQPKSNWNQILMASYAESGQTDEASKLAQKQIAADPNDPNAVNTAVNMLVQSHKYPEAIALLEKAKAGGGLKSEEQYVNLAKLYLATGQESDDPKPNATKAIQTLQDGMSKGIVKSDSDNYKLLGDAQFLSGSDSQALQSYRKAIPLAKDGEAALNASKVSLSQNKYSEAKSFAQQAIDKGVKNKGNAYMVLGESERGLKNKSAAIAAVRKAEQYPDSAAKAKRWLQANASK